MKSKQRQGVICACEPCITSETNPGNARALVQKHGNQDVWINPPPIPLTTPEMDYVFGLPYARLPHPAYKGERIPAYEMIRFSVNIMRGCLAAVPSARLLNTKGALFKTARKNPLFVKSKKSATKYRALQG